jgi:hypothetical protein
MTRDANVIQFRELGFKFVGYLEAFIYTHWTKAERAEHEIAAGNARDT